MQRPVRLLAKLPRERVGRFPGSNAIERRQGARRVAGVEEAPGLGQSAVATRRRRRQGRGLIGSG